MCCHKNILAENLYRSSKKLLRSIPLLIFSFFSLLTANAQEEFIPSPSRFLAKVPFTTFTGGVIIVKAQLGDHPDSLNFILDTGSGGISLDSLTCVRLKIQPKASDKTIRGIAGIRQVKFVYNQTLNIGGVKVDSLDFHVSDYDILSSVYGDKIDGIIGYSFLSRYIVKLDYDSNKVSIYTRGYLKYPRGGFLFRPLLVNLPTQAARIKDENTVNARFYFDTGAGLCLLLSSDFAQDSALLNTKKKPLPTQAQGLGGKTEMALTTIKELRLGPYKFRNVPTFIFDDEFNVTSYPYLGGLIGNDILRRFNVYLNYERRDFYLIPNSHYRDPFDYSYTGLGLYWVEGQIVVGDVMKGSPADKAGFKVDDIIVALNSNFSLNLQTYKGMLQNIGEKVKVIVKRPEGLTELSLKVRSIF